MRSRRALLRSAPIALAIAAGGCRCNRDHPYVPYAIEAGGVAASDDAGAAPIAPEDAGAFSAREAIAAPPNATHMAVDGLELDAPKDRVFALALAGDFDGDGARDAAALVIAPPPPFVDGGALDTGDLVLYRGTPAGLAAPQPIASPPQLPADASCSPKRRLAQVGRHTIALETGVACEHHDGGRWLLVLVVDGREAKTHFRATLLDPADAPPLAVDVDGADRDGDGLDDVALRFTVEGGAPPFEPGPRVSAVARWFDRTAGMSRDPEEPDASLRALGSTAMARAARTKEAPSVPRLVQQARSLVRALCSEAGSPRVVDLSGGARSFACGASRGLEELQLAEVRAWATAGDPLRAITAFDRAQLPPATRTSKSTDQAQAWIAQSAPITPPAAPLRVVNAVPQIDRGATPAWAALAFDSAGKLLVRTVGGVVRVDPATGDEAPAEDVTPWRSAVTSPDGALHLVDAHDPCDARALEATFDGSLGPRLLPLPIAPPLARCDKGAGRGPLASVLPVAWGPRGLEMIVAGEPLLVAPDLARAAPSFGTLDQPPTLGAPRSPSGRVLVAPTSQGLLVRGARARLLRAPELQGGWLELRDCVVSDDAARVACVRGGRAFVGQWPAE